MNILWFAFGFYILGVSVVLWYRPSLMFDGDAWKEFGLSQKGNFTIFPFWMFVLVWTFVSYIVGTLCVVGFSGIVAPPPSFSEPPLVQNEIVLPEPTEPTEPTVPNAAAFGAIGAIGAIESEAPLDLIEKPLRKKRAKGYYIRGMIKGKPAYVYYGTESPF